MAKQRKNLIGLSITMLFAAGAYFLLSPLVLSNFLVFQPKKVDNYANVPTKVFGSASQTVRFYAPSGHCIHGFFFEKPNSTFIVLLHHGQGGNLSTHLGLAKTMLLAGFSVLIYDYEGFGMSEGTASNESLLQDGEAAYNFLVRTKSIRPNEIIQCGVSLGTGVASHVAENHPCAGVVLVSPYMSLNQVAVERVPFFRCYPRGLFPHPDMGSLSFLRSNSAIPVLLIHGANDPIIGSHHAQELYALAKCPCRLVVEQKVHHGDFSTIFLAEQIKNFAQRLLVDRDNADGNPEQSAAVSFGKAR